jgi:hypothetical protein
MTYLLRDLAPVEVWGGEDPPDGFIWKNVSHQILEVCNRWRIHTRWWEPEEMVWRDYLKVITDQGLLCVIYRDLVRGGWFLYRIYD